jgi:hypothetical protein
MRRYSFENASSISDFCLTDALQMVFAMLPASFYVVSVVASWFN